ncbi:MAG: hypothetical protein IJA75_09080 [Oscillospiraceae bacterium]|nr:hypothetical protein [Oscillospiraceae bacterium]
MKLNKQRLLSAAMLLLAAVVLVSAIVYLITGKMVPGLMPLSQAALMVPMYFLWKNREPKWIGILFIIAGILNLIAGIMQIAIPH